tara:strand:+ start:405 stop:641 length:237 start_codon:yes stop_codon:yes gene_type:complete
LFLLLHEAVAVEGQVIALLVLVAQVVAVEETTLHLIMEMTEQLIQAVVVAVLKTWEQAVTVAQVLLLFSMRSLILVIP